jgi:benzodiazapine receptor
MDRGMSAIVSIGAVAAAGLIGAQFNPGRPRTAIWYASLRKPSYTPPGAAIGVAWSVLETLMCVTGYRLLRKKPTIARDIALAGWTGTLAGLAGYPALFFGGKQLGASAAASTAMFAAASATSFAASRVDPVATAASLPLMLWTGFATVLSEELWRKN